TGVVTDARTGQPIPGAIIRVVETGQTRWTNSEGHYRWGYAVGTFTLHIEKPGYLSQTGHATLAENATTNLIVALAPDLPPENFALYQNFPNPFNPMTTIVFDLPKESFVSLKLFNILGQELRILQQGNLPAARHSVVVDAWDLATGVYIFRLGTPEFVQSRRMIVTR
ncbi:MAG: carboxypeptidase regulatory-like domain-containing protein, partial [Bacteroidota bacterium]